MEGWGGDGGSDWADDVPIEPNPVAIKSNCIQLTPRDRLEQIETQLAALQPRLLTADEEIALATRTDLSLKQMEAEGASQSYGLSETVQAFEENMRSVVNFVWQNGPHLSAVIAVGGSLSFTQWWSLPDSVGGVLATYLILKAFPLVLRHGEKPPSRLAEKLCDKLINKPLRPILVEGLIARRMLKIDKLENQKDALLDSEERKQSLIRRIRKSHNSEPTLA